MARSVSRWFELGLASFLLAISCAGPAPDESTSARNDSSAPPPPVDVPAAVSDPGRVDLHGRWERWLDTEGRREAALERIAHIPELGLGREASPEEVAAIDIDIMPDGTGLPPGQGSVAKGRRLFASQCVQCHGEDGRGADYEALVGREPAEGFPFAESRDHIVTVGNYWPYATTLYDYVHRAMPQAVPGSLPPEDVYSLVAYILFLNDIVPQETVLDAESLPSIVMPARDRFVFDDREGGTELR